MSKELVKRARLIGRMSDRAINELTTELADRIEQREAERDQLREQVTLLRGMLLASANYIDALGGNSFDPRRTLAATELHASS